MYCLDTNICIYALKGLFPEIARRLSDLRPDHVKIPAMVRAELLFGAAKSAHARKVRSTVEAFLMPFEVLPFETRSANSYAGIRADLEASGTPIGPNDLVIAATVLGHGATLVTHNISEFSRVPDLAYEDWTLKLPVG